MEPDEDLIKKRYWQFFVTHTFLFLLYWVVFLILHQYFFYKFWVAIFAIFIIAPWAFQHTYFGLRYKEVRPNSFAGSPIIRGKKAVILGVFFFALGCLMLFLGVQILF